MTEDHLKLLRRVYVAWDFGEGYGAPGINPKKPYGNSSVERDIAEILDVADEDWIYEDGHKAYVTPEAEERFTRVDLRTHQPARAAPGRRPLHPKPTRDLICQRTYAAEEADAAR